MNTEPFVLDFNDSSFAGNSFYNKHMGVQTFADKVARDPKDLTTQVARRAWEDRAVSEYVGVMGMHYFHGLLVDANAPMDLQELALLFVLQEQQHCRYFRSIAVSLGSTRQIAVPIDELSIQRTDEPLNLQIVKYVFGTLFCGEQIALDLLSWTIKNVPDSPYREAMKQILKDEVMHTQMGSDLLKVIRNQTQESWCEYPGDSWIQHLLEDYLAHMLSRNIIVEEEVACFENPSQASQLLSMGIPNTKAFQKQYLVAVENLKAKTALALA